MISNIHIKILITLNIMILSTSTSLANDTKPNCLEPQTQFELNYCSNENYKKSDNKLSKLYKNLMLKISEDRKVLLLKSQKDWSKFKESHCKYIASTYEGGSIYPLIYFNCLESVTTDRIKQIENEIKEINSR